MKAIDPAVCAKLEARRGGDEVLALWRALWAAHERGGAEAAEAYLAGLIELPGGADRGREEERP
jgi:hypothetical protein